MDKVYPSNVGHHFLTMVSSGETDTLNLTVENAEVNSSLNDTCHSESPEWALQVQLDTSIKAETILTDLTNESQGSKEKDNRIFTKPAPPKQRKKPAPPKPLKKNRKDTANEEFNSEDVADVSDKNAMGDLKPNPDHRFSDPDSKTFDCPQCGKSFGRAESLKRHIRTHLNIKPYICEFCNTGFKRNEHLKRHLNTHSQFKDNQIYNKPAPLKQRKKNPEDTTNGELNSEDFADKDAGKDADKAAGNDLKSDFDQKTLECPECGKSFGRTEHLKRHIRTHLDIKPYVCELCHTGFKRNEHLKRHLITHSQVKAFICKYCQRNFTRRDHLKTHCQNKHSVYENDDY